MLSQLTHEEFDYLTNNPNYVEQVRKSNENSPVRLVSYREDSSIRKASGEKKKYFESHP